MSSMHAARARRLWSLLGVALLGLLAVPGDLQGQSRSIPFTRLSIEDGLSQSTVNCILQDRTGFLWLGTQDGLNRYDGYGFTVYKHDPTDPSSLPSNWIEDLAEDPSGDLWIGTHGGGLARWRRASDSFERFRHVPDSAASGDRAAAPGNWVRALHLDRAEDLWVGTSRSGLVRIGASAESFEHFQHDPGDPASLSDDQVRAIHEDRAGNLWIGTLGGLNLVRGGQSFVRFRHHPDEPASLSNDRVFSILEDSAGTLWVGTDDGLNRSLHPRKSRGDRDSHPTLGFERLRHDPADPASLSDNWVTDLLEDRSGRLWIATDGGLHRLQRHPYAEREGPSRYVARFERYRHDAADPMSLSDDRVLTLFEDRGGVIWVGTLVGGVNKWNPVTWSFGHFRSAGADGLTSNAVYAFSEDRNGKLFIGTGGGLDVLDRNRGGFSRYRGDPATTLAGEQVTVCTTIGTGVCGSAYRDRGFGASIPRRGRSSSSGTIPRRPGLCPAATCRRLPRTATASSGSLPTAAASTVSIGRGSTGIDREVPSGTSVTGRSGRTASPPII